MTSKNRQHSSEWRKNSPTIKQLKIAHALLSNALSRLNRGQVSDYIEMMIQTKLINDDEKIELLESEGDYEQLQEDLKKKKKSWKWKEDLK